MTSKPDNSPERESVREHVVLAIKQWIAEGKFHADDALPSERSIAVTLDVARGTVRAALVALEDEGVIETRGRSRIVLPGEPSPGVVSHAVAVIAYPPSQGRERSSTGFDRHVADGAIGGVRDAGYHALELDADRLVQLGAGALIRERPMGILVSRIAGESVIGLELIGALQAVGLTVVAYGDNEGLAGFDRVASDHAQGAYELTKWLIARGRRRIVRIWPAGGDGPGWLAARDAGHERALREARIEPVPPIRFRFREIGDDRRLFEEDIHVMAGYLLEHTRAGTPLDAVMVVSDRTIYSVAAACRILRKEPGRDVSIVGYDNYWEGCVERQWESFTPSATVDKRNYELGAEMVKLLFERLEGRLPPEPQLRLLEPRVLYLA